MPFGDSFGGILQALMRQQPQSSGGGLFGLAQFQQPSPPMSVPLPQSVIDAYAAEASKGLVPSDHPAYKGVTDQIDKFILQHKLQPGSRFVVPHGNLGPVPYEVMPYIDGLPSYRPIHGGGASAPMS